MKKIRDIEDLGKRTPSGKRCDILSRQKWQPRCSDSNTLLPGQKISDADIGVIVRRRVEAAVAEGVLSENQAEMAIAKLISQRSGATIQNFQAAA